MNKVTKTSGIAWGYGAISTATWEGVLLRDVLMYSGLLTPERANDINGTVQGTLRLPVVLSPDSAVCMG
jgi:hypothetical protein